jgi:hypothetical protein
MLVKEKNRDCINVEELAWRESSYVGYEKILLMW